MELCRSIGFFFRDRSDILSTIPDLAILTVEEVKRFIGEGLSGLLPQHASELDLPQANSTHELFVQKIAAMGRDVVKGSADGSLNDDDDDDDGPGSNNNNNEESNYLHIDGNDRIDCHRMDSTRPPPRDGMGLISVEHIAAVVMHLVTQMAHRWMGNIDRSAISGCLCFQFLQKCIHRKDNERSLGKETSSPHQHHHILGSSAGALSTYCAVVCCEIARTIFYEAQVLAWLSLCDPCAMHRSVPSLDYLVTLCRCSIWSPSIELPK